MNPIETLRAIKIFKFIKITILLVLIRKHLDRAQFHACIGLLSRGCKRLLLDTHLSKNFSQF